MVRNFGPQSCKVAQVVEIFKMWCFIIFDDQPIFLFEVLMRKGSAVPFVEDFMILLDKIILNHRAKY